MASGAAATDLSRPSDPRKLHHTSHTPARAGMTEAVPAVHPLTPIMCIPAYADRSGGNKKNYETPCKYRICRIFDVFYTELKCVMCPPFF